MYLECISSVSRAYLGAHLEGHLEALAAAVAGVAQPVAREEVEQRRLPRHAAQRLCGGARRHRAQLAVGHLGGGGQNGDRDGRPSHDGRVRLARRLEYKSNRQLRTSTRAPPQALVGIPAAKARILGPVKWPLSQRRASQVVWVATWTWAARGVC